MEQLQTVLAVVKKHHFWMLAGLVLIISLAVFTMSMGALYKNYKEREGKITNALSKANGVAGDTNQEKINNWKKVHEDQRNEVLRSWEILYQRQEKGNPWPTLSNEFRDWIKEYKDDHQKKMPNKLLEEYQYFIQNELPKLFELVNYRRYPETEIETGTTTPPRRRPGMMSDMPGAAGTQDVKPIGVIEWPETQRIAIRDKYYLEYRPSTLQVRLLQEDYWVYQALLNIIKETNGDAKTHSAAAIKEIEAILIGQDAATAIKSDPGPNLIMQATGDGGVGGQMLGGPMMTNQPPITGPPMMDEYGDSMNSGTSMPADGTEATPGNLTAAEQVLLNERYVKEDLTPLPAGQSEYAEFKMMPVYLRLKIHQKNIPELLTACANSTMPVEVKRLRINPESGSGAGNFGGGIGRPRTAGMGIGMPGMGGPGMGGGMHRPTGRIGGAQNQDTPNPYIVSIEIRGIIYLYNPPDKKTLATGTAADQVNGDGVAPDGTTPGPPGETPPGAPTTSETPALPEGAPTPVAP